MMLKCFTLFTLITISLADNTILLNNLVDDFILLELNQVKPEISVEHMQFPYNYKWLFFNKVGTVDCHNGTIRKLNSLKRTANVSLEIQENQKIKVKTSMGLEVLSFTFEQCTVDWFIVPKGPIEGSVGTNSIEVEFTAEVQPAKQTNEGDIHNRSFDIIATIDHVHLVSYANVDIKLKGTGFLHWIEQKILNLVAGGNAARKMINRIIEDQLLSVVHKVEIFIKPVQLSTVRNSM